MVSLTKRMSILAGLIEDFSAAVDTHQPELKITTSDNHIELAGNLIVSGPKGPFDSYEVLVGVPSGFPWNEPIVFETGNRIPRIADRHIFESHGSCCLGVWEEWLLRSQDHSAAAFLNGPLHDYFLSQSWYEAKGQWPFGDRSHGENGVVESFCDVLGVELSKDLAVRYLKLLSRERLKGHSFCPCGSGLRLRNCHELKLTDLQSVINTRMANRMLERLKII